MGLLFNDMMGTLSKTPISQSQTLLDRRRNDHLGAKLWWLPCHTTHCMFPLGIVAGISNHVVIPMVVYLRVPSPTVDQDLGMIVDPFVLGINLHWLPYDDGGGARSHSCIY